PPVPGAVALGRRPAPPWSTTGGGASGSIADGSGARAAISTRSPGRTACEALRTTPSTRTHPASISCFACERVPTPRAAATTRSSRRPAAAGRTTRTTRGTPSPPAGGEHATGLRHVGGDGRLERLGAREGALAPQPLDELDDQPPPVEIAREVE